MKIHATTKIQITCVVRGRLGDDVWVCEVFEYLTSAAPASNTPAALRPGLALARARAFLSTVSTYSFSCHSYRDYYGVISI